MKEKRVLIILVFNRSLQIFNMAMSQTFREALTKYVEMSHYLRVNFQLSISVR